MGDKTKIQWSDATWNPVLGCSRVSEGCRHCYAERVLHRGMTERHRGLTVMSDAGPRWNGTIRQVPQVLDQPLRWKRPRRVFVNSLSDLFHERLDNGYIAAVFGVMAAAERHQFQVLTKRPKRMREWFEWVVKRDAFNEGTPGRLHSCFEALLAEAKHHPDGDQGPLHVKHAADPSGPWPLPNVHIGVSVEDQRTADQRIPELLRTPAAVRWLSVEPMLGPIDLEHALSTRYGLHVGGGEKPAVDWVVVGGESGPGARPFHIEWARSVIRQCWRANVPVFVKQLGAQPFQDGLPMHLLNRKGGEMDEWPEDLRVREEAVHG